MHIQYYTTISKKLLAFTACIGIDVKCVRWFNKSCTLLLSIYDSLQVGISPYSLILRNLEMIMSFKDLEDHQDVVLLDIWC